MNIQADLASSTIRALVPTVPTGNWHQIAKCLDSLPQIREQYGTFRSEGANHFEQQLFDRLEDAVKDLSPQGFEPQQDLYNVLSLAVVTLTEKNGARNLCGLKTVLA